MTPARITDQKTGQNRNAYTGKREEIVEDALRKMAASGQRAKAVLLNGQFTVVFSRKALSDELTEMGHKYSYPQIEEAIEILFKTSIEMTSDDGDNLAAFHPIQDYGFRGRDGESNTYVKFCSLVTESIHNNSFRLINYKKLMSYSSVIARKMHKRMANNFTYAGEGHTYNTSLSTIFQDFGLSETRPAPNKLIDVKAAFQELIGANVIESYSTRTIIDPAKKIKRTITFLRLFRTGNLSTKSLRQTRDLVRRGRELTLQDKFPELYGRSVTGAG